MNARILQVDFDGAVSRVPVALRFKQSAGVLAVGVSEPGIGPQAGSALVRAASETPARPDHLMAVEKPFAPQVQPIRWGINE